MPVLAPVDLAEHLFRVRLGLTGRPSNTHLAALSVGERTIESALTVALPLMGDPPPAELDGGPDDRVNLLVLVVTVRQKLRLFPS